MNFCEISSRSFVAVSPVIWGFKLPLTKNDVFLRHIALAKKLSVAKSCVLAQASKFHTKEQELKSQHSPPLRACLIQTHTFL